MPTLLQWFVVVRDFLLAECTQASVAPADILSGLSQYRLCLIGVVVVRDCLLMECTQACWRGLKSRKETQAQMDGLLHEGKVLAEITEVMAWKMV